MKWCRVDRETPIIIAIDAFETGFGQEALNLAFPARKLRCPEDTLGPPWQAPLGSGCSQSLFGALRNQIPFDLCEQTKHGDHHLGLDVLVAVKLNVLLDGHELHTLPDETVHQLDDLGPHSDPAVRVR